MQHSISLDGPSFPQSVIQWRELAHFRSWQGIGITRFFYFFLLVVSFFSWLAIIIGYSIILGVGGFFLGLVVGTIVAIFWVLGGRIGLEIILSIFAIRDSLAVDHKDVHPVSDVKVGGQPVSYQDGAAPEAPYL